MIIPLDAFLAAAEADTTLHIGAILMLLLGGLALFLMGMDSLSEGLNALAGRGMKQLLERFAGNRFTACLSGVVVTAAAQSSSVTSVLLVGFTSAGLVSLSQAVAILLGAGVGSTFTAQIIAFNITAYAPLMLFGGFVLQSVAKRKRFRFMGQILLSMGLIFFGMGVMSEATQPLRTYQPFIDFMSKMDNVVLGILVGTAFTALVQSSAATAGIVIALAAGGLVNLEAGIALILGANIGTCITGIIAAIGKPTEAMQASTAHLVFKIVGTVIIAPFVPQLAALTLAISPADPSLSGAAQLAAEAPRHIANAFTLSNVIMVVLFIGFIAPIATVTRWIVPRHVSKTERAAQPKFIDRIYLETPSMALDKVHEEIARQGRHVLSILELAPEAIRDGDVNVIASFRAEIQAADSLHNAILDYLSQLAQEELLREESDAVQTAAAVSTSVQGAVDVLNQHVLPIADEYEEKGFPVSEEMAQYMRPLYQQCLKSFSEVVEAIATVDVQRARHVLSDTYDIKDLARDARAELVSRLGGRDDERLQVFRREAEVIEAIKRIHYYARHIAKEVVRFEKE